MLATTTSSFHNISEFFRGLFNQFISFSLEHKRMSTNLESSKTLEILFFRRIVSVNLKFGLFFLVDYFLIKHFSTTFNIHQMDSNCTKINSSSLLSAIADWMCVTCVFNLENKCQRIYDVTFTATVWTDNTCHTSKRTNNMMPSKGFKVFDFEMADFQLLHISLCFGFASDIILNF